MGELKPSSKRRGIDRRRRKFQTPAAEALYTLFGRRGVGGGGLSSMPGWTSPRWAGAAANSRAAITQGPGG